MNGESPVYIPSYFLAGIGETSEVRGEQLSYGTQLFAALQKIDTTTVLGVLDKTRALVVSGIKEPLLIKLLPDLPLPLNSVGITDFGLFKFDARAIFAHVIKNIPTYDILLGNTGLWQIDEVRKFLDARDIEREIPDNLADQIIEVLRKEGKLRISGGYHVDDAARVMLKTRFSSQTLQHNGRILIKIEHAPENRVYAFIHVVKTCEEIEQEYMKNDDITFLWVDQSKFFEMLINKKT